MGSAVGSLVAELVEMFAPPEKRPSNAPPAPVVPVILDSQAVSTVPTAPPAQLVTADVLRVVMPRLPLVKLNLYLPFLQQALAEFLIDTPLRAAAFLGEVAEESIELRYFEEIASGAAYEGRKDLGNTQPGDGVRYKGRGPIQLTGRGNYRKYGLALSLDLEGHPELAADPSVGFRTAGLYWKSHGLNELADAKNLREITRRINGGELGESTREMYYRRALGAFGVTTADIMV
jgi:predicted chitinase